MWRVVAVAVALAVAVTRSSCRLVDLSPLQVKAQLNYRTLENAGEKRGRSVTRSVSTITDWWFSGKLSSAGPVTDSSRGLFLSAPVAFPGFRLAF